MTQQQILSGQQLDSSALDTAVRRAFESHKYDEETMLPAIVLSFDRDANVATVQPLIQLEKVNGSYSERHKLTEINVLSLGGGGFNISFPLVEGALGWIIAGDRDIAIYKQELKMSPPNSSIPRRFANGLFIPDVMRKYVIAEEDSAAMVIQSIDGQTKISIREDNIKIATTVKFLVDAPDSEFTGNVSVLKNLTVTGQTTVNGGFTAKDATTVTLPSTTTINGITVSSHGHEQQNDGSGRTAAGMIE